MKVTFKSLAISLLLGLRLVKASPVPQDQSPGSSALEGRGPVPPPPPTSPEEAAPPAERHLASRQSIESILPGSDGGLADITNPAVMSPLDPAASGVGSGVAGAAAAPSDAESGSLAQI